MKSKLRSLWIVLSFVAATVFGGEYDFGESVDMDAVWRLVLKNNENVGIFELNDYQAYLMQEEAWSQWLPNLRGEASLAYSKKETDPGTYPLYPNFLKTGKVIVSQTLYDGRINPATCSAKFNWKSTKERSAYQTAELLYLASAAYLKVLQNEQLLLVSEKQLELAESMERMVRERYDAGEVAKTDLLRASVEVSRSKRERFSIANAVRISREELSNLAGVDLNGYELSKPEFLDTGFIENEALMDGLVRVAWDQRKDIKSLESRVQSRLYDLQSARRGHWPRLVANAEYQLVDPDTLVRRNNFWAAVLTLEIPIFDRRETTLLVNKISALLQQDRLELERLRGDVEVQVADAWLHVANSRENVTVLEMESEVERENYAILNERYRHGQASNIDLTDSFQKLIAIEANRANEEYRLLLSSIRLYKDVGIFDGENLCNACDVIKGIRS